MIYYIGIIQHRIKIDRLTFEQALNKPYRKSPTKYGNKRNRNMGARRS